MSTKQRVCALPECGNVLVPRSGEGSWHFNRRQYCDRSCAGKARQRPINHGTNSGAQLHRRRSEDFCEPCKVAERGYQRDYAAANPEYVERKTLARAAELKAKSQLVNRHWREYQVLLDQERKRVGIY